MYIPTEVVWFFAGFMFCIGLAYGYIKYEDKKEQKRIQKENEEKKKKKTKKQIKEDLRNMFKD